jgi:ankyrin repeat protein
MPPGGFYTIEISIFIIGFFTTKVSLDVTRIKTMTNSRFQTSIRVIMPLMILVIVAFTGDVDATCQQSKNSANKVRELIHAAAAGDSSKVLQLLNSGVNVNAAFERDDSELSGMTALMAASSRGHSELVQLLIKRGANVNLKHYSGTTALMSAAGSGDESTVKALLDAGADVNAKVLSPHAGEFTPLTTTINTDHPQRFEIARILLAAKAEVNPKGPFVMSPLMHALEDLEMVKLLIAHGADINQKNFRGATPLMGAAVGRNVAVVKYLIEKGADVKARDKDGYTALMGAENERTRTMFYAEERDEIIRVLKRAEARVKP